MKFVLLVLMGGLFFLACEKEEVVTEPDSWKPEKLSVYLGDWNLSARAFHSTDYRVDSLYGYTNSELYLTLTDSAVTYYEEGAGNASRFYYGELYQDGEMIALLWNGNSIRTLADPEAYPALFYGLRQVKLKGNNTFKFRDGITGDYVELQKSEIPYSQDSLQYRIEFTHPPPNIGLMIGYMDSDGEYSIDTLKSGNWQWKKKVLQTGPVRNYQLDLIGATESFYDAIDGTYGSSVAMLWNYGSAGGQHPSQNRLRTVNAGFYTDGTATFDGSPTSPSIKLLLKTID